MESFKDLLNMNLDTEEVFEPLTSFPQFSFLPSELRIKIWGMSIEPRVLQDRPKDGILVSEENENANATQRVPEGLLPYENSMNPAILFVNRESRHEALKKYENIAKFGFTPIYFNHELDMVDLLGALHVSLPLTSRIKYRSVRRAHVTSDIFIVKAEPIVLKNQTNKKRANRKRAANKKRTNKNKTNKKQIDETESKGEINLPKPKGRGKLPKSKMEFHELADWISSGDFPIRSDQHYNVDYPGYPHHNPAEPIFGKSYLFSGMEWELVVTDLPCKNEHRIKNRGVQARLFEALDMVFWDNAPNVIFQLAEKTDKKCAYCTAAVDAKLARQRTSHPIGFIGDYEV